MTSPDLAPELVERLLESLASWDPRASVPLELTYMRVGDKDALEGLDAVALANPIASEMLEERYLSPTPDVAYLRVSTRRRSARSAWSASRWPRRRLPTRP